MKGVIANIRSVAARGHAQARRRLDPLWLIAAAATASGGRAGRCCRSGERVSFHDSEVVFQYFPGEGLQIHPLANFGKLNALVALASGLRPHAQDAGRADGARCLARRRARLGVLLRLRRRRARLGVEPRAGHRPAGALARRRADRRPVRGLPRALRTASSSSSAGPLPACASPLAGPGDHYAQYSFAPGLRILNGFIQSLNGLDEFADQTGFEKARALFDARATPARG